MTIDVSKQLGLNFASKKDTAKLYVVRKGDNLTKIAKRYGVSVADILKVNPKITDANKIVEGETIRMPAVSSSNNLFNQISLQDERSSSIFSGVTRENPKF